MALARGDVRQERTVTEVTIRLPQIDELSQAIRELQKTVVALEGKVSPPREWYTREDCARARRLAKGFFEKHPNLLPGFGIPEDRHGAHCWSAKTFKQWLSHPLEFWEQQWASIPWGQRARMEAERKGRSTLKVTA